MKTCFLIAPIGDPDSPARRRTDKLEEFVLKPILASEYSIVRADRIPNSGIITNQVIRLLISADLVIADMTDHNPNVFYEMGIRHATRRPIIHIRQKQTAIPFDAANMRAFEYSFDVAEQPRCIEALAGAVSAIGSVSENPFSSATLTFMVIRGASNDSLRSLDLVQTMDDVRALHETFLEYAAPGVTYWGQTVGGMTISPRFFDALQNAINKGATFRLIINDNPPYSTHIIAGLERCVPTTAINYCTARDCQLRFFGLGTSQLMIGLRIEGLVNALIIRDFDLIQFFHGWFTQRFERLRTAT